MADLKLIPAAQRAIDSGADIGSAVLATGRKYITDYDQLLDAAAAGRAAARCTRRQPQRYSDMTWAPGSGAALRQGYDGTQMAGRDY
jgi:hypothetical protein